jgi:hypothetical protein
LHTLEEALPRLGRGHYVLQSLVRTYSGLGRVKEALAAANELHLVATDTSMLGFYPGQELLEAARELAVHGLDSAARLVATQVLQQVSERARPTDAQPFLRLTGVRALELLNRYPDALREAEAIGRNHPQDWITASEVGFLAAHLGDSARAIAIARSLSDTTLISCEGGGPFMRARILTALGHRVEAVDALRLIIDRNVYGCVSSRFLVHQEPEFLLLKGFAPFDSLLRGTD